MTYFLKLGRSGRIKLKLHVLQKGKDRDPQISKTKHKENVSASHKYSASLTFGQQSPIDHDNYNHADPG